jgi:hypothetical protein
MSICLYSGLPLVSEVSIGFRVSKTLKVAAVGFQKLRRRDFQVSIRFLCFPVVAQLIRQLEPRELKSTTFFMALPYTY